MVEFTATGELPADFWSSLPGVEAVHQENSAVVLSVRRLHETVPALLAALESRGSDLLHLTTRDASLEDVFVHLTGRHLRED